VMSGTGVVPGVVLEVREVDGVVDAPVDEVAVSSSSSPSSAPSHRIQLGWLGQEGDFDDEQMPLAWTPDSLPS